MLDSTTVYSEFRHMFMVSATSKIHATPERVWQVIADFASYPKWNTQLSVLEGSVAEGARIKLRLDPLGASGYEFQPRVIAFQAPKHFAWIARTGLPRIFDGEHHFELERTDDGNTILRNYEVFRGLLSPVMKRLPMMRDADAGFERMNQEIAAEVARRGAD